MNGRKERRVNGRLFGLEERERAIERRGVHVAVDQGEDRDLN